MMTRIGTKALHLLTAMGCVMLVGACEQADVSYRYRVTVEVDTPQGVRSGSSVWETKSWEGSGIPDTAIRSRAKGEAVAVDLPGGTLFALMRGADMAADFASGLVGGHVYNYPPAGFPEAKDWKERGRAIAREKPAFELYPDEYPLLVRFRDINDPKTVEKVEPTNLAASFGPRVRLKRIVVTVTNDAVTSGIERYFPWWDSHRDRHFDGTPARIEDMRANDFAAHLSSGSFSSEFNR